MIISASGGREWWWCALAPFAWRALFVRSGSMCVCVAVLGNACDRWRLASVCDASPAFPTPLCAILCGSTMTELDRVFERVVVGDCDALSSVHPSSGPS